MIEPKYDYEYVMPAPRIPTPKPPREAVADVLRAEGCRQPERVADRILDALAHEGYAVYVP